MVTFNNKKIELYDLDSIKSIIRKLAASENTLPDFIYFPEGTPEDINLLYDSDVNINYENLLQSKANYLLVLRVQRYIKNPNLQIFQGYSAEFLS